ncbi:VWA domain-containing protein [Planctomycetaceae bacterium SH139]
MRALAVMLVVLIMVGPQLLHQRRVGTLGKVTFVVDASESMQTEDVPGEANRAALVARLLGELPNEDEEDDDPKRGEGLLGRLADTHELQVISSPGIQETDLAELLRRVQADGVPSDRTQTAAMPNNTSGVESGDPQQHTVVLLSDGRNNLGDSPIEVAEELARRGIVVATVGVGDEREPDDLAIIDLQHPQQLSPQNLLRGKVRYKRVMSNPQPTIVRITDAGGKIVWQQQLPATAPNLGELNFEFDIDDQAAQPEEANSEIALSRRAIRDTQALQFTASIATEADLAGGRIEETDLRSDDQQRQFSIAVIRSEYRVLLLAAGSRWEFRYLKNLFGRDPNWDVTHVQLGPGTVNPQQLPRGGEATQFPATFDELMNFDLVVLGEVDATLLPNEIPDWFVRYVDRGGALVMIDGTRDHLWMLAENQLEPLMPVRWIGGTKGFYAERIEATTVGAESGWLNLVASAEPELMGGTEQVNNFDWSSLPPPHQVRMTSARQDAEVLLTTGVANLNYPLLVRKNFGGGRVLYLAAGETWRWRYLVGDTIHAKFWNQLALSLMPPPMAVRNDVGALDSGKVQYTVGEQAALRVRLRDASGVYQSESSVQVDLLSDGQIVQSVPLIADGHVPGLYQGLSESLLAGNYETRLTASGYGPELAGLTTQFTVADAFSQEGVFVARNQELLSGIAAAGGGESLAAELDELVDFLAPRSSGRLERSQTSLWDSYYWFVPLVVLLCCEWWTRKRVGLP